jgi:hypothetical protein
LAQAAAPAAVRQEAEFNTRFLHACQLQLFLSSSQ